MESRFERVARKLPEAALLRPEAGGVLGLIVAALWLYWSRFSEIPAAPCTATPGHAPGRAVWRHTVCLAAGFGMAAPPRPPPQAGAAASV